MDLSFEKIIELIEKGKYIDPKKLTDNSFVLVSNEKWTLDQLRFFNAFKKHIKNEYNLEFTIIGGGKSCSKLILDFTGSDENIERLLTLLLTDIRLKEFAKELCLKYAIQLSNSNSLNFDKEQIYQTAPYTIHNIHNIYVESKSNSIMDNQSFSNNGSINNSNVNGSIKKSEIANDLRINGEIDETLNEIRLKIKELEDDRLIDIEQTSLLLEYLADLTEELKKPKPKKNYVDLLLDKISQFDSLTSLTERLLSYMLIQ